MRNFYLVFIFSLIFTGCSSTKQVKSVSKPLVTEVALKDLQLKIIKIGEKRAKYNDVSIDYEITNNSNHDFMNKGSYVVYFSVITKSGKELISYSNFFKKIPKKKTLLLNYKLKLSTYNVKEVTAKLVKE